MHSKHIPALDGVRGTAVLVIVAFHTLGGAQSHNALVRFAGTLLRAGWTGVTLFFVLSGFLITGILYDGQHEERQLRNFYLRRTLRIAPLYYAAVLLVFLSFVAVHLSALGVSRIWILALYLQNLPWLHSEMNPFGSPLPVFHLWSLAVEEQFYLIWPFLILWAKTLKRITQLCILIFLLSAIYRIFISLHAGAPTVYGQFLFARAGELVMGAYLACCYRYAPAWTRLQRWAPGVAFASLAVFAAVALRWGFASSSSAGLAVLVPAATFFFAALIVMSLGQGLVQRAMSATWLRWFGSISYGLYVFHVLFSHWYLHLAALVAPHAGHNASALLTAGFTFAFSTALAWLSFRYFERPVQRLRSRLVTQRLTTR